MKRIRRIAVPQLPGDLSIFAIVTFRGLPIGLVAFLFAIVTAAPSTHAQEAQVRWDVRVNEGRWDALSLNKQRELAQRFRGLGLLQGNGQIINDPKVDPMALKVEIQTNGTTIYVKLTTPDTCPTSEGKDYKAGEVRADTNQECECGWFSCKWVVADEK